MIWTHPTKTQIPNFPKVFIGSSEGATKTAEDNGAPSAEGGGPGPGWFLLIKNNFYEAEWDIFHPSSIVLKSISDISVRVTLFGPNLGNISNGLGQTTAVCKHNGKNKASF